jgi:hypothetical protein
LYLILKSKLFFISSTGLLDTGNVNCPCFWSIAKSFFHCENSQANKNLEWNKTVKLAHDHPYIFLCQRLCNLSSLMVFLIYAYDPFQGNQYESYAGCCVSDLNDLDNFTPIVVYFVLI